MKYHLLMVMLCSILLFGGCGQKSIETENNSDNTPSVTEQSDKDATDIDEDTTDIGKDPVNLKIYGLDENAENLVTDDIELETLDEQTIWKALQDNGKISAESTLLEFSKDEKTKTLYLDVDHNFGDRLRSFGTSGENSMMISVVNTYLDAYECERLKITEEGDILVSGHAEYTGYLQKITP